jgi:hypothetical protein
MTIVRRLTKGLLAGALIMGLTTPTFAAAPLTKVFDKTNIVQAHIVATDIGEVNPTTFETTFVSAVQTSNDALRVHAYYLDAADQLISADADDNGTVKNVDVARVGGNGLVVVAAQLSTNQMKLIAFDVSSGANGREITRLGESTPIYTLAETSDLTIAGVGKLTNRQFVTAARSSDEVMHLDSWVVSTDGTTFTRQASTTIHNPWGRFKMIGNYARDQFTFATAHQNDNGNMVLGIWSLASNGTMTRTSGATRGIVKDFDLAYSSNRLYTASHTVGGAASVERWAVNAGLISVTGVDGALSDVREVQVFDMHNNTIVVTWKDGYGNLRHQAMQDNGTDILTGVAVDMQQQAASLDGVYTDDILFFAMNNGSGYNMSHELWKN